MFLSAIQPYIVAIIIAVIVVQYAFALFCLLKLAYLDIDKKYYILWNVFILLAFFIGGAVFLVYYYKRPELRLSNAAMGEQQIEQTSPPEQPTEQTEQATEQSEQTERADESVTPNAEQAEAAGEQGADIENTNND